MTDYGKKVKCALVEREKTIEWLTSQVNNITGYNSDGSYISNILAGRRNSPVIVKAINKILNITGGLNEQC